MRGTASGWCGCGALETGAMGQPVAVCAYGASSTPGAVVGGVWRSRDAFLGVQAPANLAVDSASATWVILSREPVPARHPRAFGSATAYATWVVLSREPVPLQLKFYTVY